ncbi:MAG: HTH domain-containing protein [Bacteroidales bacterium]
MENQVKVLAFMVKADSPVSPGQIAEGTGLDRKVVDKAIKQLKDEQKIESPRRCFYAVTGR